MITELVAHIKLRMILTTVVPLEPCSSTQNEYSMFNGSFTTLAALLANLSNKTALGSMAVKAAEPIVAAAQNYTQALASATGDAASTTAATVVNTTAESAVAAICNTKAAGNYISSKDSQSLGSDTTGSTARPPGLINTSNQTHASGSQNVQDTVIDMVGGIAIPPTKILSLEERAPRAEDPQPNQRHRSHRGERNG